MEKKAVVDSEVKEAEVVSEISLVWANPMFKSMAPTKKSRLSLSMLLVWNKLKLKSRNL